MGAGMDDDRARFGAWLTVEIERRGLSAARLADMTGATRQSVSDWTRGASLPSLASAILLLDALAIEGAPRDRALRLAAGLSVGGGE